MTLPDPVCCTSARCPNSPTNPGTFWEDGQYWDVNYCDECVKLVREKFTPRSSANSATSDDKLLADLFRRALAANITETGVHLKPSYRLTLRPGLNAMTEIELTDAEVNALRRSV
jgi:hypothetical protein